MLITLYSRLTILFYTTLDLLSRRRDVHTSHLSCVRPNRYPQGVGGRKECQPPNQECAMTFVLLAYECRRRVETHPQHRLQQLSGQGSENSGTKPTYLARDMPYQVRLPNHPPFVWRVVESHHVSRLMKPMRNLFLPIAMAVVSRLRLDLGVPRLLTEPRTDPPQRLNHPLRVGAAFVGVPYRNRTCVHNLGNCCSSSELMAHDCSFGSAGEHRTAKGGTKIVSNLLFATNRHP